MAANVNNYIQAGAAAINAATGISQDLAVNNARYDKMAMQSVASDAEKRATRIKAKSAVKRTKDKVDAELKVNDIELDTAKQLYNDKKQMRMAGMLAGGAQLLSMAHYFNKKKDEPNAALPLLQQQADFYEQQIKNSENEITSLNERLKGLKVDKKKSGANTESGSETMSVPTGSASNTGAAQYQGLTGSKKILADAIAGPESGKWGYDAFNQGGAAGGTQVLGKSGAHKDHFGKSLTSMTIGEVLQRQSGYDDKSISDEQWRANGGLWAVGRYQFIGPTLKNEVAAMGLPMDTMFDEKTQDAIFFSHAKRVGNISPWVGPSTQYGADKRAELNAIIQGL